LTSINRSGEHFFAAANKNSLVSKQLALKLASLHAKEQFTGKDFIFFFQRTVR